MRKVLKHVQWARTEGLARLVEEDRLDPRDRVRLAVGKARWRHRHGVQPGEAVPVYVVGLQRSGTNMLLRGLDEAPEMEVRGENDRAAFERFRLRSDAVVQDLVVASRHQAVLFKPICDSHRVAELLDLPRPRPGRALWVYRDVEGRARSEVSKFGRANLMALQAIADGRGADIWQGQALTPDTTALIRSLDPHEMGEHTAAALFWVVRNELYFQLGLDAREDVLLVSYDAFAAAPQTEMRRICTFLGFSYRPELCEHVNQRATHGTGSLVIDPRVRALATAMEQQLEAARTAAGLRQHPA